MRQCPLPRWFCLFALLLSLLPSRSVLAQATNEKREKFLEAGSLLVAIDRCLHSSNEAMRLRQGLVDGWHNTPQPPPDRYIDSLREDYLACEAAQKLNRGDEKDKLTQAVKEDIAIKARDCESHGMGRLIRVTLTAEKGSVSQQGWQVFYKWSTSSNFAVEERRVPGLAGPSSIEIPPGTYEFRGEKTVLPGTVSKTAVAKVRVIGEVSIPLVVQ